MTRGTLFGIPLRDYLAGGWRIERVIDDRLARSESAFKGEAQFAGHGDPEFQYREEGILTTGIREFRAVRRYTWSLSENGADIAFADGRFFHRIVLDDGTATARHDCPPDLYDVQYVFETPDRWRQAWVVTGPRKDYSLESVFTRLHRNALPVHSPRK